VFGLFQRIFRGRVLRSLPLMWQGLAMSGLFLLGQSVNGHPIPSAEPEKSAKACRCSAS